MCNCGCLVRTHSSLMATSSLEAIFVPGGRTGAVRLGGGRAKFETHRDKYRRMNLSRSFFRVDTCVQHVIPSRDSLGERNSRKQSRSDGLALVCLLLTMHRACQMGWNTEKISRRRPSTEDNKQTFNAADTLNHRETCPPSLVLCALSSTPQ